MAFLRHFSAIFSEWHFNGTSKAAQCHCDDFSDFFGTKKPDSHKKGKSMTFQRQTNVISMVSQWCLNGIEMFFSKI
jgi:hypothetical protein